MIIGVKIPERLQKLIAQKHRWGSMTASKALCPFFLQPNLANSMSRFLRRILRLDLLNHSSWSIRVSSVLYVIFQCKLFNEIELVAMWNNRKAKRMPRAFFLIMHLGCSYNCKSIEVFIPFLSYFISYLMLDIRWWVRNRIVSVKFRLFQNKQLEQF